MLSDEQFIRYQRQVSLPEWGESGQEQVLKGHVLIIGVGGLGSAAALYLCAAGVGKLVLVDDDKVELSNLQRQVSYRDIDLEKPKTEALKTQLHALNAHCQIRTVGHRLSDSQLNLEIALADVVLDCSDNFETRHQINRLCFEAKRPLIFASAIGWQGQFAVFDFSEPASLSGCYSCLLPEAAAGRQVNCSCSDIGVVGPVVGTLGNYQALATLHKLVFDRFAFPTNLFHVFDGKTLVWQRLSMTRDNHCAICGDNARLKSAHNTQRISQ